MQVARMGVEVDSGGVVLASDRLNKMTDEGEKAEKAVEKVGKSSAIAGKGVKYLVKMASGAIATFASFNAMGKMAGQALDLNKSLAQASTLLSGTTEEMAYLKKEGQDLARTFGGSTTKQIDAFYSAISAGATDVVEARKQVHAANQLALGGATDVATGVDALSTAVNAYSKEGLTAADASDAMFVAIKDGKTTADELAGSMGRLVPIASAAGISFDEMLAATAALTTQGQSTATAMTGLRGVISNILKPTKDAEDLAKALGIEFNATALEAMGLHDFLEMVIDATEGNTTALAKMFGSVQALNAALALSGAGGDKFSATLDNMRNKAGATQEAVDKMSVSLNERLASATGRFAVLGEEAGGVLISILVPAMEAAATTAEFLSDNFDIIASVATSLAVLALPTLISAVVSLTATLGAMGVAAAVAAGPIGIVLALVSGGAAYFLLFRDNANEAELALYDAAAGSEALNTALGVFHATGAPSAGKAAVSLANDNYKLAQSALAAAEAEMAKLEAMQKSVDSISSWSPFAKMFPSLTPNYGDKLDDASEKIRRIRMQADQARFELMRASETVTGADYSGVTVAADAVDTAGSKISEILAALADKEAGTGAAADGTKALADELAALGEAWEEKTRAPMEQYKKDLAELERLLAAGVISQETFTRALAMIQEELNRATSPEGYPLLQNNIDGISQAMANAITNGNSLREGLSQVWKGIANDLLSSGIRQAIMDVFNFSGIGGGGGGGGFWGGVKKVFGFEGGGFTGSGSRTGGIDGRGGIPAVVHPNETIIDHTKGQGMGGAQLNFAPVIDARGADAGAVDRLEAELRGMKAQFGDMVHQTLRHGNNHRRNQSWDRATL